MTRLRILGAAALALVMLASDALAQETSREACSEPGEARRDERREMSGDGDSDVRAEVREAVREALHDQGLEGREEVRDARREGARGTTGRAARFGCAGSGS